MTLIYIGLGIISMTTLTVLWICFLVQLLRLRTMPRKRKILTIVYFFAAWGLISVHGLVLNLENQPFDAPIWLFVPLILLVSVFAFFATKFLRSPGSDSAPAA
jgi:hypothetical protein